MMQTMRQNMKAILWILILAFIGTIVFSWGMGGFQGSGPKQGIVASINGVEITFERLQDLIQQKLVYEQNQSETDLTEYRTKQIRTEVWDELVRDIIIEQEVQRLGIKISDKEIAHLIQTNPPDFIRQNEYFQTDGFFDETKYQEFLRNPRAASDLMMIEESYRKSLPQQKFLNQILALASVTDQEVWQKYTDDNLKGKASYVLFDKGNAAVDSAVVTDKQIEDYYFQHRDEYFIAEKRQIIYTMFPEQPSSEDSAAAQELADEIVARIDEGDDFAELAKEFSEDVTSEKGGDLGFFARGQMVPEFEEAAFSTKVGEVKGPVMSQFGYHIIKVTDKRKGKKGDEIAASHILLKIKLSPDTRDKIGSSATGFAEETRENDFASAAEIYGVEVDTSSFFDQNDIIPGVGRLPAAVDFIFARLVGETSMIYSIRDALLVFRIFDVQKAHTQELAEVRNLIFSNLYKEAKLQQTYEQCGDLRKRIDSLEDFASIAEAESLEVKETELEFKFDDYVRGVGRDLTFTSSALRLDVGELSQPVKGQKGYYLIQLTEKTEVDSSEFLEKREELRSQLLTSKQNQYYSEWLRVAQENADIEDFRYLYYRDY
ncbi:hypothetical protein CEE37_03705 [candidate division LCP-89 bacterium B3_LCP]|uniref:Periplasmic chaperone PpiD n=1 Tax=candidate division LCP-89 bacterium B3_LCP TaxID=2012998 RepID=A0A532V3A1_UNCL8|nr:MAG: hypothetical protein CEE37_03705 [candidate division LCP-89 bacterium B3_LCP]